MANRNVDLYIATAGGAFMLVLADLLTNLNAATTLKIGTISETYLIGNSFLGKGMVGLIVVIGISLFVCWIYRPKDRASALARGLSVFAILNVATPYSVVNQTPADSQDMVPDSQPAPDHASLILDTLISPAYADDKAQAPVCRAGQLSANATLKDKKNVSSCKPYPKGVLGLSSLINNSIGFCISGHTIAAGARVRYLESWETSVRSYRYSKIEYQHGNQVCTGWVSDGRKNYRSVIPDQ